MRILVRTIAAALLDFLLTPDAATAIEAKGMEPG